MVVGVWAGLFFKKLWTSDRVRVAEQGSRIFIVRRTVLVDWSEKP